jgi:hypothetical protein
MDNADSTLVKVLQLIEFAGYCGLKQAYCKN